ncbi:hypothetical protein ACLQ26_00955 [Micromonospora sp. DT43]|uniref:hypothetical protein n=1 Tax=Micromonospora sp. DT43 TaxID=3393440 RepID=UPI003CED59E1
MSSLLAQVVAQLRSTIDRLDALAVQANRAATDVAEGNARYAGVGRGTDHPKLRAAVSQSRTGADKALRIARLSSDAARNVADFLNVIAPGSAPQSAAAASGPPSGEDLLADSDRRDIARAKARGWVNRSLRKADDLQEHAANATDKTQKLIKVFTNPNGPSGTQSTGTGTPTVPASAPRARIDGAEAAGNLVVVGLLAGVAASRLATTTGKLIARFWRRGR